MDTPPTPPPPAPQGEVRMVSRYSVGKRLAVLAWVVLACLIAGVVGLTAAGVLFGKVTTVTSTISGY